MRQNLDEFELFEKIYYLIFVKKSSIEKTREIIRRNLESNFSIDCSKDDMRPLRGLQHYVNIRPSDPDVRSVYEFIVTHALAAETRSPGSGLLLLKRFCNQKVQESRKINCRSDLFKVLENRNFSRKIFDILLEVIEMSNISTTFSIKKSATSSLHVEETSGYRFNVNSLTKIVPQSIKKPKISCIDGYIESVSEIHHLFLEISEKKDQCLLFVRGASDDVLNTIKVNRDRGTMVIFPFAVPFDPENVNTIVDIAVVSGTDVISSTKGQTISSSASSLVECDSCSITSSSIVLENNRNKSRIEEHKTHLKSQMAERQDIVDILSKRISCLSASHIEISLPDDMDFSYSSSQLDEGLRIVSSIINNTYNPEETSKILYDSFEERISNIQDFYF